MAEAIATQDPYTALVARIRETPPLEVTKDPQKGERVIGTVSDLALRARALQEAEDKAFARLAEEFSNAKPEDRIGILSRLERAAEQIHLIDHFIDAQVSFELGRRERLPIGYRTGGQLVVRIDQAAEEGRYEQAVREALVVTAERSGNTVKVGVLTGTFVGGSSLEQMLKSDDLPPEIRQILGGLMNIRI